ncbi:MAG: hypothetical protein EAZ92_02360 [Candidatus Kapaibacterium sp.]|nr:MAG: hypothetical protein EAZ92_02360 [Candidatus Kapabacteria bacterium]
MIQKIFTSVGLLVAFVAAIVVLTLSAQAQSTAPAPSPAQNDQATTQASIQRASSLDEPEAEALFQGPLRSSGYGALGFKFTPLQGNFGTMLGGYGGWFINKTLLIGGGGYGLTSQLASNQAGKNISFGYGGIVLEYVGFSDKVFHYAVQGFVGWGGAGFYQPGRNFNFNRAETTGLMVFEPSVLAELNVSSFLRLSAGAGYRIVTGSQLEGLTNADLSSYSISLNIKFGSF